MGTAESNPWDETPLKDSDRSHVAVLTLSALRFYLALAAVYLVDS